MFKKITNFDTLITYRYENLYELLPYWRQLAYHLRHTEINQNN